MSKQTRYPLARPQQRPWLAIPTKRRGRKREVASLGVMALGLAAWAGLVIYLLAAAIRAAISL